MQRCLFISCVLATSCIKLQYCIRSQPESRLFASRWQCGLRNSWSYTLDPIHGETYKLIHLCLKKITVWPKLSLSKYLISPASVFHLMIFLINSNWLKLGTKLTQSAFKYFSDSFDLRGDLCERSLLQCNQTLTCSGSGDYSLAKLPHFFFFFQLQPPI